ncbi:MAG: hypothetical protein JKY94_17400 [Rhodobacteraceae bacterium]|nr:hypothetical protein [Paracoccaceae bacterium]
MRVLENTRIGLPKGLNLKSCVNCGPNDSAVGMVYSGHDPHSSIYCDNCGSDTGTLPSQIEAIASWNRINRLRHLINEARKEGAAEMREACAKLMEPEQSRFNHKYGELLAEQIRGLKL